MIFEPIQIGPFDTTTPMGKYLMVFISLALVVVFVENLMRSRSGRAMIAVRDQDIAAAGSAVSPLRYKLLGGLAVRRACYGVLRYVMEAGAKGCEVVVSGKLRAQRAKAMKFSDG